MPNRKRGVQCRTLDLGGVEATERPFEPEIEQVLRRPLLGIEAQERTEVVADALGLAHHEARIAEDARRDKARKDVPADHVRGLAERLQLRGRPRVADRRDLAELRLDDRRAEEDGELVLACAHELRHVERMRDEHVRRLAHLASVEEDVAERVQPVKLEKRLFVRRHIAEGEGPRVEPLMPLVLPHSVLVVRVEKVRQQARRAEVQFVAARHRCRNIDRRAGDFLQRPHAPAVWRGPAFQLPRAVERGLSAATRR